jgi:hypothetical protein
MKTGWMKTSGLAAALGLALIGTLGAASAQPYGGPGYGRGYDDRDFRGGRDYGGRDYGRGRGGYDEQDYGRGRRSGFSGGFNEREYLRCNADVRRALQAGTITSAADHYRIYGQREGRRLSC